MANYKHILTDFKDLRKVIGEITKTKPAKTRYQQQAEKMGYQPKAGKKKKKWKEPLKGFPGNEGIGEAEVSPDDLDSGPDVKQVKADKFAQFQKQKAEKIKKVRKHAGMEEIQQAYMDLGDKAQGSIQYQKGLIQKQLAKMGYKTYSKMAFDEIFMTDTSGATGVTRREGVDLDEALAGDVKKWFAKKGLKGIKVRTVSGKNPFMQVTRGSNDKIPNDILKKAIELEYGKMPSGVRDVNKIVYGNFNDRMFSMSLDKMAKLVKEEVDLDEWKMGDGRPRGASHIENIRFWDLPKDKLEYIKKDSDKAMKANPNNPKNTKGKGNYADQINDADTVLAWRKKKGIKEEVDLDEDRQLKDPKKEVMVVKSGKVIVIDKKDAKKYLNQGWELAEEVKIDESKFKDLIIKGQDLEIAAKASTGGKDKNDMMKVAAMLKKGDKSGALSFAKKLDDNRRLTSFKSSLTPQQYVLDLLGEGIKINEGGFKDIAISIDQGDTPEKIAKKYKLDLKYVKQLFKDYEKVMKHVDNLLKANNDPGSSKYYDPKVDEASKQKPYASSLKGQWHVLDSDGEIVKSFGKNKAAAFTYLKLNFKKLSEADISHNRLNKIQKDSVKALFRAVNQADGVKDRTAVAQSSKEMEKGTRAFQMHFVSQSPDVQEVIAKAINKVMKKSEMFVLWDAKFSKQVASFGENIEEANGKLSPPATWWKSDPDELLAHIYWLRSQIPPQDRDKAYKTIVKIYQKKYKAPKKDYERHFTFFESNDSLKEVRTEKIIRQSPGMSRYAAGLLTTISKMLDKKYSTSKISKEMGLSNKDVQTLKQWADDINNPKSAINSESRSNSVKEEHDHAKQSPFKLKSQQYPRAVPVDTEGFGKRHATVEDILSACDSFGMIIDKELQIEQVQKTLGKKGFISYKKEDLVNVFHDRETERMILALESDLEKQEPTEYTQGEIAYAQLHEHDIEFLKPDGQKAVGPILKMGGSTFNVKDKYTGKSFTYKYTKIEEENVKTFSEVSKPFGEGREKGPRQLTNPNKEVMVVKKNKVIVIDKKDKDKYLRQGWTLAEGNFDEALEEALAEVKNDFGLFSGKQGFNKAHIEMQKTLKIALKQKTYKQARSMMNKLQKKYSKLGADDTEPHEIISGILNKHFKTDHGKYDQLSAQNDNTYKNWIPEAEGDKEAYKKFFNAALKKFGVSSPDELEGDKKKEFFDYVDKNWKGDHEEVDVHKSYRVDGRRTNFREKMRKLGYIKNRF